MEPILLMRKARLSKSLSHRLELGKFLVSCRLTQLVESRSLVINERTGAMYRRLSISANINCPPVPVEFHNLAFIHDHDLHNYQKIFAIQRVCSTNPVVVNDGPQPVCDGNNCTICKLS